MAQDGCIVDSEFLSRSLKKVQVGLSFAYLIRIINLLFLNPQFVTVLGIICNHQIKGEHKLWALSNFCDEIALSLVQITKNAKNGTVHALPDQYSSRYNYTQRKAI
jgi:hypothetical protein